jgi:polyisoprenoid-binding protein YceI
MSTRAKALIVVAVVVVAGVAGGLYWFLRDDAPDPVSLESAVDQVEEAGAGTTTAPTETTVESALDGTWTIDSETGNFDFESATGTFAGFRVDEELAGIGASTAVGRTGDVTGSFTIEGGEVTEAGFEVDLTTITTNDSRRDDRVQEALETGRFPTATFALTEPVVLGPEAEAGDPVSLTAVGDLTVHGVTRSVDFPLEAQLVDGTVVLIGSLDVTFADYGVEAPTSIITLSVEDHGVLELQFPLTST